MSIGANPRIAVNSSVTVWGFGKPRFGGGSVRPINYIERALRFLAVFAEKGAAEKNVFVYSGQVSVFGVFMATSYVCDIVPID
jgi:hypothetical protein